MVGSSRLILGVIASLFIAASSTDAFGGRFASRQPTTVYHYAVPSYLIPYCTPLPKVVPVPDARKYADPTAAPPSPTGEPPLQKKTSNDPRTPVIVAAHSSGLGDAPVVPTLAKGRCRVGFWNLSGRDITVVVGEKTWSLPKDRSMTLELDRQFAWQVLGQTPHSERVPDGNSTHEVVIRE